MSTSATGWVAVIDDDASIRRSIVRFLSTHGIPAEPFATADGYVQRASADPAGCMVLDAHLAKGMSAFDLLDRMAVEGSRVPVIVITGQLELHPSLCERYPELHSLLRKPFDPVTLLARVRQHLRASDGLAPAIDPSV